MRYILCLMCVLWKTQVMSSVDVDGILSQVRAGKQRTMSAMDWVNTLSANRASLKSINTPTSLAAADQVDTEIMNTFAGKYGFAKRAATTEECISAVNTIFAICQDNVQQMLPYFNSINLTQDVARHLRTVSHIMASAKVHQHSAKDKVQQIHTHHHYHLNVWLNDSKITNEDFISTLNRNLSTNEMGALEAIVQDKRIRGVGIDMTSGTVVKTDNAPSLPVTHLRLNGNQLTDGNLRVIAGMKSLRSVEVVGLANTDAISRLSTALLGFKNFQELMLGLQKGTLPSDMKNGDISENIKIQFKTWNESLITKRSNIALHLNLEGHIMAVFPYLMTDLLVNTKDLRALDINLLGNRTNKGGISKIAGVLKQLTTLSSLELRLSGAFKGTMADIRNEGAKELTDALKKLPNLSIIKLFLSEAGINGDGAQYVADFFAQKASSLSMFMLTLDGGHLVTGLDSFSVKKFLDGEQKPQELTPHMSAWGVPTDWVVRQIIYNGFVHVPLVIPDL